MEIVLVLHNIRSTYNVGAILRTAEGFGVKEVVLSGYTPKVHDATLLPHLRAKLDREIHKTALGAEEMLKLKMPQNIDAALLEYRCEGWQIVGLENNIADEKLVTIGSKEAEEKLTSKVVLVLGEEVGGIDSALYDKIDLFLEIPMRGLKESFNVSVAAGIALFALTR